MTFAFVAAFAFGVGLGYVAAAAGRFLGRRRRRTVPLWRTTGAPPSHVTVRPR